MQSRRAPIFYVDLVIKEGLSLQEAVAETRETANKVAEEHIDQAALDAAAATGFGNALFEYDEDEMSQLVEEFFPANTAEGAPGTSTVVSKLRTDLDSHRSASR